MAGALLALALLGPGTAAADGPHTPYIVAHGKSLYRVPWRIKMSEGPPLAFATQLAPAALCKRFHWLRGVRFFDQFYPEGIEPTAISAYDQAGQLIERQPA